jgi:hypothetical protein
VRQGAMKKTKSGDRNILIMGWKDKRVVLMMSTYHDTSVEENGDHSERGNKEIQKPVCVLDYTKNMGCVDHSDHYCATYTFIWKSLKWLRKPFSGAWKCAL